jgi:hypothetical protein
MNLPGFTAEASITTNATTHFHSITSMPATEAIVVPSLRNTGGGSCGACTETKWPNGTGTGACVQDCTDVLGRHYFQSCSCGGSTGVGGIGSHWGNIFLHSGTLAQF